MYIVQMWLTAEDAKLSKDWRDVATISVPAKTKRKTVIAKAVALEPSITERGPAVVRVIPAEHAEPIKVEMEQPPPQLRIG